MSFKRILSLVFATLLSGAASAQRPESYEAAYKRIDSLLFEQGLTATALKEADKLYERAKKEKNNVQLVHALVYKVSIVHMKEEDADQKGIRMVEEEIDGSSEPAKSILQNLAATLYWQYFRQMRWRIYDRTETANFSKDDPATWSVDDFHSKISALYLASLHNKELLQQTSLTSLEPIIVKGNVRHLRPTLYDLLAHQALEYFKTDERTIARPAYAFEINEAVAFADAETFARHRFSTNDSLALEAKALALYQELILFHLKDATPDALADVDIQRLEFVNNKGVMPGKDSLYKQALEGITAKYKDLPAAAQAWYLLADWYAEKARQYDPQTNPGGRFYFLQAKAICERVLMQKDTSEGWVHCKSLLTEITRPALHIEAEKVNVPNQPFRMLVNWRNTKQVYFRVIQLGKKEEELLENYGTYREEFWEQIAQRPAFRQFRQTLPDAGDYQQHRAEIKTDGLPVGRYLLLAGTNEQFKPENNLLSVVTINVSNIAYIKTDNGEYFALHRQSGQPLAKANVQVWYRYYDVSSRRNAIRRGENIIADQHGFFKIPEAQTVNRTNFQLEITVPGDHLFLQDYHYTYYGYRQQPEQEIKSTFLFTDRSIYRPGQTVYVKGIVVTRKGADDTKTTIIPDFRTTLYLRDANYQVVDSLNLITNEFGSYSGRFTIPSGVLNGRFTLTDKGTGHSISIAVEEYKRPRFYAEIAKPAGTWRLYDTIQVTGAAKAYAGNTIDGAEVKYRVVRKTIMPLWRYSYSKMIWPPHAGSDMEIAHGTTTTDAAGNFSISFAAIPDNKIDKKMQPVFYYEITADITDIAGETRSASATVAVAWQALKLQMDIPENLPADSLRNIRLASTNLADSFVSTTVTLSMHRLETPGRIFRERYWAQPDTFVMSRNEYYRYFPYDVYLNENEPSQWKRAEKVFEITGTTTAAARFALPRKKFAPGWYVLEAVTKDRFGEEVKSIRYVQLYTNMGAAGPHAMVLLEGSDAPLEPGQRATCTIGANVDSAWIIRELEQKDRTISHSFYLLSRNIRRLYIPVTEADRGGMYVNVYYVKHNRVYTGSKYIDVPYTNKELTVSYATYRDKTMPGSEEKWTVTISGPKREKVAAELLTGMYDASLDQLNPHQWNKPGIWSGRIQSVMEVQTNFAKVESQEKHLPLEELDWVKIYDRLLFSAYERITYGVDMGKGKISIRGRATAYPMAVADSAPEASMDFVSIKADITGALKPSPSVEVAPSADAPMPPAIQPRKNFNETAFFFPDLRTDKDGNITFSFTMPEAVTEWKWMSLAHTKDLAFGYAEKSIVTQKDLMVQPNAPRFFREGDRMDFITKIANVTDREITGQVELQLIDPSTGTSVDGWFRNMFPNQYFTVPANQSVAVNFSIEIPFQYNRPVTYRVIAGAGNISDGEEAILPVVSNRMLVTESLPMQVVGQQTKSYEFSTLLMSGHSETLEHHAITVEFTSNPAWYAVQALPYLMEYPYECSEQVFNRYYANALATTIANASPRLKEVFERWKTLDTAALLSNLQKNEQLKSVLLQETPWVLQAKNETEQKKKLALLFDMVRMSKEGNATLSKLKDLQLANGGFAWFKGGRDDRYITQYILTGIGHLQKLKALPADNATLNAITQAALRYADLRIRESYEELLRQNKHAEPEKGNIAHVEIQYLYMRSFFPGIPVPANVQKAYAYYFKQAKLHWIHQSRYMQGMIALALYRMGEAPVAKNILASLKENAIDSKENGMHWKEIRDGYFWYDGAIEAQALMIEAFAEIDKDANVITKLKTWLLKQKQTQHWRTTKATADACYALLLQGSDWLTNAPQVTIRLGDQTVRSSDQPTEAGTGYFQKTFDSRSIKANMGHVKVTVKSVGKEAAGRPAWGAVYWQYFENLDKISHVIMPLQVTKKLFVEKNSDRGPVLHPLNEGDVLQVGDKVTVRIEIRNTRDMDYVHMKDMRAACLEPVNVLSQYKWQGGLGYYESTKDAATNFFFSRLPKGTFVFEYPLYVTHTGTFSNGITTIQCMYAPEFTSHSEGVKVRVE